MRLRQCAVRKGRLASLMPKSYPAPSLEPRELRRVVTAAAVVLSIYLMPETRGMRIWALANRCQPARLDPEPVVRQPHFQIAANPRGIIVAGIIGDFDHVITPRALLCRVEQPLDGVERPRLTRLPHCFAERVAERHGHPVPDLENRGMRGPRAEASDRDLDLIVADVSSPPRRPPRGDPAEQRVALGPRQRAGRFTLWQCDLRLGFKTQR